MPKYPVYQSPRYSRRGALQLMAALSVADGLGYGQCHARKRFVDFRCLVETVRTGGPRHIVAQQADPLQL